MIYAKAAKLTLTGSTIQGNLAAWYGGGVSLEGGTAIIQDSQIIANRAGVDHTGNGGGVNTFLATATLRRNIISHNIAYQANLGGGGVYSIGSSVVLKDNEITYNTCNEQGRGGGSLLGSRHAATYSRYRQRE